MSLTQERKNALRRYILGTSPEAELAAFDAELAQGAASLFEELKVAEADLLDSYAAGELSPVERDRVEETYASTGPGRRRLAFASALRRRAAAGSGARRAAPSWIPLAAALGAIAVGGGIVVWQNHSLRGDIGRLRSVQQQWMQRGERLAQQVERSEAEIARLRTELEEALRASPIGTLPKAAASIARLALSPGLLREASSIPELTLAGPVQWVELELQLPADGHQSYRVAVETPEGKQLWRSDPVAGSTLEPGHVLKVRLPVKALVSGTHLVAIAGATSDGDEESVADYTFRVRSIR